VIGVASAHEYFRKDKDYAHPDEVSEKDHQTPGVCRRLFCSEMVFNHNLQVFLNLIFGVLTIDTYEKIVLRFFIHI
jgi:hypothetical protein